MRNVLALCFVLFATTALCRDNGQYADVDPAIKKWFGEQLVPGTSRSCCTEADGAYAEEDIIQGQYWARWRIEGALTAWQPVPPEAVIPKGNRNGSPVVWWGNRPEEGGPVLFIRCYAPGGGV